MPDAIQAKQQAEGRRARRHPSRVADGGRRARCHPSKEAAMPHHMAMRRRVNQKAMKLLTPFELQAEGGSLQPAAVNAAVSHAAVRAPVSHAMRAPLVTPLCVQEEGEMEP